MIICKFCKKEAPTRNHQVRCPLNGNRKMKQWTPEEKLNTQNRSRTTNLIYWTAEKRQEQSIRMQQVVLENKDSYSKNNVSGRVKTYEIMSSAGLTKVKGKWELAFAEWLNNSNIIWTNNISPYRYKWNNSWHLYFPDFYLEELGIIVEIKGFQTDRDLCKWASVTDKEFKVIRKNDLGNFEMIIRGDSGHR